MDPRLFDITTLLEFGYTDRMPLIVTGDAPPSAHSARTLSAVNHEIAEQNFTDTPDTVDRNGHGTHVAAILADTGARSGGKYRGVASGTSILDGKVLDDWGSGTDSTIIAGMQWAVDQGADIVNMSIGGFDYPGIDPMEEAVNTLSAGNGTLFVIAAGNMSLPGSVN